MSDQSDQNNGDNSSAGSLSKKALGGVSIMSLTVGTQMTLQLLSIAVLARLLDPAEFGIIAAANIIIAFSNMFSDIALGSAIIQLKDMTSLHIRVAFTLSVASSVFVATILYFAAPYAAAYLDIPETKDVIRVLSIVFLWTGLSTVAENLMSRSFRYKTLGIIKIAGSITGVGVTIICALMGYSYWSIAIGVLAQSFQAMIFMMAVQKHDLRPSLHAQSMKDLMVVGGGLSLSRFINYIALNADKFFIARFIGADALGLYDRSYRLAGFPAQIFDKVAAKVALSSYARAQDNKERMNFAFRRGLSLTALVGMPLTFLFGLIGPEIVLVVLGEKWEGAIIPFIILVSATFFRLSYKVSQSVMIAVGRVFYFAAIQIIYASIVLIGCYMAYPYGINAIAYAVTGSIIINFIMLSYGASRVTDLSLSAFMKTGLHGFVLVLLLTAILAPFLFIFRPLLPPVPVLLLSLTLITLFGLAVLVSPYKWLWGEDGLWLRSQILEVLEKKLPHITKKL